MALPSKEYGTYVGWRAYPRPSKPLRRLCHFYWMAPRPLSETMENIRLPIEYLSFFSWP